MRLYGAVWGMWNVFGYGWRGRKNGMCKAARIEAEAYGSEADIGQAAYFHLVQGHRETKILQRFFGANSHMCSLLLLQT